MKIQVDRKGYLVKSHKTIKKKDIDGESAEILMVRGKENRRAFINNLNTLIKNAEY